jgi:hypothetical protein
MKPCSETEKRTETAGPGGSVTRASSADPSLAGLSASQALRIRVGGWIASFFSWYRY